MKKTIMSALFISMMTLMSCGNKSEKKQSEVNANATSMNVGVRGNCTTCKHAIETAVKDVDGVIAASWSVEKKKIDVSFDKTKTNAEVIEKAIAASGYDTEHVVGNKDSYKNLPSCCQYDHTMNMNQ